MGLSQRHIAQLLRVSKTCVANHLQPPHPDEQWYTAYRRAGYMLTSDVARRLGISAQRVRELARQGRIPFETTEEGVRLYRPDDVEDFWLERASL